MKLKRDSITGVVLVIMGIMVFLMTFTFDVPFTPEYPGPKMIPFIAAFGMIVCGLGIFIESLIGKKEEKVFLTGEGWLKVAATLLVIAAYIAAMMVVGYLIATPVILYTLTTIFASGKHLTIKGRIIFSLVTAGIIYIVYVFAFGLTLPSGFIFN